MPYCLMPLPMDDGPMVLLPPPPSPPRPPPYKSGHDGGGSRNPLLYNALVVLDEQERGQAGQLEQHLLSFTSPPPPPASPSHHQLEVSASMSPLSDCSQLEHESAAWLDSALMDNPLPVIPPLADDCKWLDDVFCSDEEGES